MKYLFFDLEFAACNKDGKKICEFGYILVNEHFDEIERLNLLINPNIGINDWDNYVVENILTRSIYLYNNQLTFDYFYEQIKKLFSKSDYIFGYSVINDIIGINDELKRYQLPPLSFDFYDVQKLYSNIINIDQSISLSDALEHYSIEKELHVHDAESDAISTMKVFKEVLRESNLIIEELLNKYVDAKDTCYDYSTDRLIYIAEHPELIKENNFIQGNKFNRRRYSQLVEYVVPLKEGNNNLKDKKVYISVDYTNFNYVQTLNLIQLIKNENGEFVKSFKHANIYVRYPGEQLLSDDEKIENFRNTVGPHLQVIEFNELLELLGVNLEDINDLPEESFYFLKDLREESEEDPDTCSFFDIARDYRK